MTIVKSHLRKKKVGYSRVKSHLRKNPISFHFKQISKIVSGKQKLYYKKLLEKLKPMKVEKLVGKNLEYVKSIMHCAPEVKECFKNAQDLVINSDGRIKYVEGFYYITDLVPIPFGHAWCKIGDTYFDPTEQFCRYFVKRDKDRKILYMGKEYSKKETMESMLRTGVYGDMLNEEIRKEMK